MYLPFLCFLGLFVINICTTLTKARIQTISLFPPCILKATEPKLSPSWNPKIVYEPHPQLTRNLPEVPPSDPVQISRLIGRMELSLTLKQNEVLPGAKVSHGFMLVN